MFKKRIAVAVLLAIIVWLLYTKKIEGWTEKRALQHYGSDPNLKANLIRTINNTTYDNCKTQCQGDSNCTHLDFNGSRCRIFKGGAWFGSGFGRVACKDGVQC